MTLLGQATPVPSGLGEKKYDPAMFQWLALSAIGVVVLAELALAVRDAKRGDRRRAAGRLPRIVVWGVAAAAIDDPSRLAATAHFLGIDRAADLVLYLLALAFLAAAFYFHARCIRLERRLTELARRQALESAEPGRAAGKLPPIDRTL